MSPGTLAPTPRSSDSSQVIQWPRSPQGLPPGTTRAAGPRKVATLDQPRWVMLRSLVVPGWGQLHNRQWIKGVGIAGAEIGLIVGLVDDEAALDRLSHEADALQGSDEVAYSAAVAAYNARLDQSVTRRWWLGGLIVYALVDAYVDAHFVHFETEFETDPALPEGVHPPQGARISLGWAF
ncbi:MAG TPA: DUF5683 domain-containing protein [Candidatus Eisenbacteria bacterium]